MILLDTDSLTLQQYGQQRFLERFRTASDNPAITIVTRIEALRGRSDAVLKAADGEQLQRAQQGLTRTQKHLEQFGIVQINAAASNIP